MTARANPASSASHALNFASNAQPSAAAFLILAPFSFNSSTTMKLTTRHAFLAAPLVLGAVLFAAPVAENWENHCAKCHGMDGKGQTKAGKKVNAKDYTSAKVQAEMKDADMFKATKEGVIDKNGKEKMKPYKDELSDAEITELVAYVRKFKS
jgi:cytochrome c6